MNEIRNGDHIIIPHYGEIKKYPLTKAWMAKTAHKSNWAFSGWTEEQARAALDEMVKSRGVN